MTTEQFAQLLTEAGLQCHQASRDYGVAFSVSLQVPTQITRQDGSVVHSIRYQVDWLVYQPAEFAQMSLEAAQRQIEVCKKKLERAARTKQGVVK